MLARKAVENVGESSQDHQNVDVALNQGVETPSEDVRVEENTELQPQNVDKNTREVAEILVSNSLEVKINQWRLMKKLSWNKRMLEFTLTLIST